jgi:hypothetical protein
MKILKLKLPRPSALVIKGKSVFIWQLVRGKIIQKNYQVNGPVIPYKRKLNRTWNKHLKKYAKRLANKIMRQLQKKETESNK